MIVQVLAVFIKQAGWKTGRHVTRNPSNLQQVNKRVMQGCYERLSSYYFIAFTVTYLCVRARARLCVCDLHVRHLPHLLSSSSPPVWEAQEQRGEVNLLLLYAHFLSLFSFFFLKNPFWFVLLVEKETEISKRRALEWRCASSESCFVDFCGLFNWGKKSTP